ncbi:similar to Saccharomyces cerevisiae YIL057C RGI2 Protein of unknown function involved in energy metabolism under respiratory conditions [Maudiozyma saulgeensis]|uniref:Respiratory growth induced protein 1 n=1 Tax=Maudiozyma saulgeensis TaxID=1789683 RepID=A0A1X7R2M9_9SACH|nr:similar to Saccharomyces cerevisiae YIL057C RGI2 Protein of unknown function involved in energy metabolism under respiratory conditions [Kazachstania saulgeensis]
MTKHEKKVKVSTITDKNGDKVKVFEDLDSFENFVKNSAEDNEFENVHCQLNYYPPFIMHETHDDPDKIKDTENSHSKKFVRHLHQHVEKHLLKDIGNYFHQPLKFKDHHKEEDFEHITWSYNDEATLNDKHFNLNIEVTCHHDDAMVAVDYKTSPVV